MLSALDIKIGLLRRGVSQASLARKLDCSDGAVSRVILRKSTSCRVQKEISRALGRPFAEVWGGAEEKGA